MDRLQVNCSLLPAPDTGNSKENGGLITESFSRDEK
jgi:hypothetical protein